MDTYLNKGRPRDAFKVIKDITGDFTARVGSVKNDQGKSLTEDSDIKKCWKEYTEKLYAKGDNLVPEPCKNITELELEPEPTLVEVEQALREIKNRKASGVDNIPIELIKHGGDDTAKVILALCQQIWRSCKWPVDWKRSVFIPIPKKGDAQDCGNNCTIALISHTSKILLKIIQK